MQSYYPADFLDWVAPGARDFDKVAAMRKNKKHRNIQPAMDTLVDFASVCRATEPEVDTSVAQNSAREAADKARLYIGMGSIMSNLVLKERDGLVGNALLESRKICLQSVKELGLWPGSGQDGKVPREIRLELVVACGSSGQSAELEADAPYIQS